MMTPKHILVPIDHSMFSLAALQYAEEVARIFQAAITVLHVIERSEKAVGATDVENKDDAEHSIIQRMRGQISNLLIEYNLVPQSLRVEIRSGHADREILKCARDLHVDLIIMSTHGRTGLRHVLIGSVAEKIVRNARCPVLTVKPEEFRELVDLTENDVSDSLHIVRGDEEN
jgi:universal stress protein A